MENLNQTPTDALQRLIDDEQGFNKLMGPLLGAIIRNSLKELVELKKQINQYGVAFGNPDKLDKYLHEKSDGRYLCITENNVKLEADWADGTMYVRADGDGPVIIRNKEEFHDGRFKKIETELSVADWAEQAHLPREE